MKDLNNIEDLFKGNLSGFEADPGAGVWENIAQNLPAQNIAAGSTAAATKVSLLKMVAGVLVAATAVTFTVVYLNSDNKEEKKDKKENATSEVKSEETTISKEENTVVVKEEIQPETELQQNDIIVKDEKKNKTIIVSVKENPKFNMNKSSVDSWITKRNNYTNQNTNSDVASTNAEVISNDTKTEQPTTFEVKEVNESKPIASIKRSVSGGPAPLTVSFSNATIEKNYEWSIEDAIIKEASFMHVFEVPGTYQVKLTVKDAKGNSSSDIIELTVGEPLKTEAAFVSKVTTGPNVFTPNGDGQNDYFYFNCENIESFVLQVTDMEGKQIYFETSDPDFKWDGTTLNGDKIPDGRYIYYYKAIGKDKLVHSSPNTLTIKTKR